MEQESKAIAFSGFQECWEGYHLLECTNFTELVSVENPAWYKLCFADPATSNYRWILMKETHGVTLDS